MFSEDIDAIEQLLCHIEDEGSEYGMKLNKNAKLSASEDKAPSDSQTAPLYPLATNGNA